MEELKEIKSEITDQFSTWYTLDEVVDQDLELVLRQLLWNELELQQIDFKKTLFCYTLHGYYHKIIDSVNFKVLWTIYLQNEEVTDSDLILLVLLLADDDQLDNVTNFVDYVYLKIQEFGPLLPHLDEIITVYEEYSLSDTKHQYETILGKLSSIEKRPEYIETIIDNSSVSDLIGMQQWTDWKHRGELTTSIIRRKLESIECATYEDLQRAFNSDPYLQDFPISLEVVGEKLTTLPPQTLDMELLGKVHPQLVQEWAPKFVYSSPELSNNVKIYFPGGRNIGHSAILIKTKMSSILLDFGLSVVNNSLPQWMPQLEKLDAILITHAHLDHSGSLPLLMGKDKRIPWFGTSETKLMTEMLWFDTMNILTRNYPALLLETNTILNSLSSKSNIINTLSNFHPIETGQHLQLLPDIQILPHQASHLFGSVGFEIDLGNKRILYTGDFNGDGTPSFDGAVFPTDCDVTIFDGTYYGRYETYPRSEKVLKDILQSTKRILIPSFSMGRAQEMLFQLKKLDADKSWKIYLTGMGGKLAREMNFTVGKSGGGRSTGVSIVPTVTEDEFGDNCIVISGQGMLQVGTSRRLLEATKDDENTTVVLCGYQAPNTMGFHLLQANPYLQKEYKQRVVRVKMSGHTSGETLDKFLDELSATKILVHSPEGAFENKPNEEVRIPQMRIPFEL